MTVSNRNLVKPFSIFGFILAEGYMIWTVLAPNAPVIVFEPGPMPIPMLVAALPPPFWAKVTRLLACGIFFGPFGALVGMGAGLLATGFLAQLGRLRRRAAPPAA